MSTTATTRRTDADLLGDAAASLRAGGALALTVASVIEALEAGDMRRAVRALAARACIDGDPRVALLGGDLLACERDSY